MSNDQLSRIEGKIDAINVRINAIDVTLAKQHEQLTYHIKRTDLLEKKVEPIAEKDTFFRVLIKLIGVCALLAAIYKVLA